jgi:hypothetical protein
MLLFCGRSRKSKVEFIMTLAHKIGRKVESKDDLLHKYIVSRPANVDLSKKEIMKEVRAAKYSE